MNNRAFEILAEIEAAHDDLLQRFGSTEEQREGFQKLRESFRTALSSFDLELVTKAPEPGEWSIIQNLEHVRDHDKKYIEVETKGLSHYIAHGEDHVAQITKTRNMLDRR